jgi:hypothetical protein
MKDSMPLPGRQPRGDSPLRFLSVRVCASLAVARALLPARRRESDPATSVGDPR